MNFDGCQTLTKYPRYQGNMSIGKRSLAVSAFKSKDKATIMLMSQKCGGVGLNLTRANRK